MSQDTIEKEPQLKQRRTPRWLKAFAGVSAASAALNGCAVKGATVFYEPQAVTGVPVPSATEVMKFNKWAVGNCQPDGADDFIAANADTLAGWSLGRLGPAYFLETASAQRKAQVRHIIYYDPANYEDYTTNTCDQRTPTQSAQLAGWLSSNPNNHVTIVNGWYAVDAAHPTVDGKTSAGTRQMLLANISGTALAGQVKLCEASALGHQATLTNYESLMAQVWTADCPAGTTKQSISPLPLTA